ncbi:UL-16 binding protein 5-like [Phyllostomus discolor]|uniref:UL-16 binding protein 5-like n=1 Tax=Phyllostomus discolor TaxID=89673 RepID=A0A7E6DHN4_9CHIR|nr:UL-16 binding protein 5-like [Phyllostomus discolor]
MEPTGSQFGLALLVLMLLPGCPGAEDSVGNLKNAPSICSIFSVSASGPSWCVVRGKINEILFLKYTCRSLKAKPIGPLGVMLSATEAWDQWVEHWKDLVEELRKALLDNQQNIYRNYRKFARSRGEVEQCCRGRGQLCLCQYWNFILPKRPSSQGRTQKTVQDQQTGGEQRAGYQVGTEELSRPEADLFPMGVGTDPLSLQGSMKCQQESNGRPSAFWEFGVNGQRCLHFEVKNRRWTELHPGCRSLKETLDSDRDLTNLLVGISRGDCAKLLHQSTVLDTKEDAAPKLLRVWSSSTCVPSRRLPFRHPRVLNGRPPGTVIVRGIRRW